MAKLYHPDVCDDAEDAARFLRAKAAYEVLVHATTGDLEDVKTEAWKSKWRAQLARLAREAAEAKRGDEEAAEEERRARRERKKSKKRRRDEREDERARDDERVRDDVLRGLL